MPKHWRFHPHQPERIAELGRTLNLPAMVAQILLSRDMADAEVARTFLDPKLSTLRDPAALPGVPAAATRILRAVSAGERIVIYGDYDVDGVTGTAILYQCLKLLGATVSYYVPHRLEEGYGLNHEALRGLAAEGAQLVVTVDCGMAAVAEARTAAELGLALVVTDHHHFAPQLPTAEAIVHPALPGASYPFAGLSGSGVAFKLAWELCRQACGSERVSPRMRDFLLQAVALASLGTVADVVPLVDENRVLVCSGLDSLRKRPGLGLQALLRVSKLHEKPQLASDDIAFTLAPRINAAGRLGQARLAVELLTTESADRAQALAEYLSELNNSRQSLERSIYLAAKKQAEEQFDPASEAALVLAERGWHAGVIGIVASRIVEKFHRPTVLISLDELGVKPGIGSARSVPGFDLHAAISACGHHLVSFGGHKAAAGLRIEEGRVADFRAEFVERASEMITPQECVAELWIDAEIPLSALTMQAVNQLERLAPFGHGNRRPVLCATGVKLVEAPRRIGGGGRHLSLKVEQHGVQMRAVAFGGGDWLDELTASEESLSIAFHPVINEFGGRRKVEMQVADWRPAQTPAVADAAS